MDLEDNTSLSVPTSAPTSTPTTSAGSPSPVKLVADYDSTPLDGDGTGPQSPGDAVPGARGPFADGWWCGYDS